MSGFEWFLLVVVVIIVPLVVAVMVTLWTLEQARQRKRQNRPEGESSEPVKRRAVRDSTLVAAPLVVTGDGSGNAVSTDDDVVRATGGGDVGPDSTPDVSDGGSSGSGGGNDSGGGSDSSST